MTATPKDYGDPKPSDLDDVPPINRGDLLEEHSYRVSQIGKGKDVKPRLPAQVNPDTGQQLQKLPRRTSHMAVIVRREAFNRFLVLRQDGRRGIATTRGDDQQYDGLSVGEYVSIEAAEIPDTYYITGCTRNKELDSLVLYNGIEIGPTNTQRQIFFDTVELKTGSRIETFAGGFRVLKDRFALYEISYSVTVEAEQQSIETSGEVVVSNNCPPIQTHELERPRSFNEISFERESGFRVDETSQERCKAFVSLNVPREDYLPRTSIFNSVEWTDHPYVANSMTVGTQVPQGWLHLTNINNRTVSLAAGNRTNQIMFPNNIPVVGSHLFISGLLGEAIQLRWTKSGGGTGRIQAYDCYGACATWIVQDGLVVSGPGITPAVQLETPNKIITPISTYYCDT